MSRTSILLALSFLLSNCSSLSKEGATVRLASEVGPGCKFLSVVSASVMDSNGDNALRNQAAALGGNWVVITGHTWQGAFKGNVASKGEVYACPQVGGSARRVDTSVRIDHS